LAINPTQKKNQTSDPLAFDTTDATPSDSCDQARSCKKQDTTNTKINPKSSLLQWSYLALNH
jgi:hypothetical protein